MPAARLEPCQWFPLWPYPASCEVPADPAQTTSLQLAAPAAYRFLVEQPPADPALAALLTRGIARLNSSRLWLPTEHRTRGNIVEPHLVQLEGSCLPSPPRITPQTQRPAQTQLVIRVLSSPTTETSSTSSPTAKPPDADESFTLTVSSTGEATLESASVWGALYGLDAFAQLVSFNASTNTHAIHGAPIRIQDRPRFPWRGLMLDTANHYLPLAAVRRTLDLMGLNRLNVLHWHILGSYSFPVRVPAHPPLAGAGAWSSHAVYTEADLRSIQLYAADRGVRVVVEVDLPGHAYAWGLGYPHITVPCPSSISADIGAINSVPFNPANPDTFAVIGDVLDFFAGLLPDPFLHLGGDELQPECWAASQEVRAWMQTMNFTNYVQVQAWFQDKAFAKLASLQRRPIVWQETFVQLQHHYPAPAAVVEVWNNSTVLNMAISAGWDVILANGWYLDRQVPVDNHTSWFWLDTWAFMYQVDPEDDLHSSSRPQTAAGPQTAPGSILGGEANMWTEQVSDGSLDTRVWPRASAIAERLWSPQHVRDTGLAAQRLSLHSCRLANMGLNSGPIWAGFCNRDTGFFNSTAAEPFVPDSCPSSPLQASNGTGPSSHRVDITAAELAAVVIFTFIGGLAVCAGAMAIYRHTHPSRPAAKSADDGMMHVQSTAPRAADEQATPLLSPESAPSPPPSTPAASPASSRLMSLDVFRGFTVALMIFVDMTGASFPPIHHSPWNGVRLADFVMPFFDFIVGVSLAFSLKKIKGKRPALWKATVRFIKLFLLGLFTQGGIDFLNYDLKHIRIMGILQRVAVCYYAVALMEIFLPRDKPNPRLEVVEGARSVLSLFWRFRWHWLTALCLMGAHTGIMYGVDVPPAFGFSCGRGVLTPACNAATYVDKKIFSVNHMYYPENGGDPSGADMTYQRMPECSSCSPGKCVLHNAPAWCAEAPFDPEGLVSSLNAIITTVIGIHFGHIFVHILDPTQRFYHFLPFSVLQLVVGLALHFSGAILLNTDLYSISFVLVTGGVAGIVLAGSYYMVDIRSVGRVAWLPFRWLGMNPITIYVLAEGDIIDWFLGRFYWGDEDKSLMNLLFPTGVYWGDDGSARAHHPSYMWSVMLWTIAYIALWMLVAYWMHRKQIYIKI